jgi:hypothetical protein
VTVGRANEMVTIKFDLHWKDPVYHNRVAGPLKDYFDGVAGQGMLLAVKHPWRKLPETLKRFEGAPGRKFPLAALTRTATANRMGLPYAPEQRVSWMVELLPSLGYENLYSQIDRGQGWNTPENMRAGRAWIPEFLDPHQASPSWRAELVSLGGKDLGATHFVGLSGVGQDAAELDDTPANAKRLGIFGYNRQTSLDDVQRGDGLSNTIYMIQSQPNIARPWIRGGGATVQGVPTKNSFEHFRIGQRDATYGAPTVFADGSVRIIRPGISDEVFQALATYKGGEKIEGLDDLAPVMTFEDRNNRAKRKMDTPRPSTDVQPASPPLPNWQTLSVQTLRATFAMNMPRGRMDQMANLPERKTFICDSPATRLTYGFDAVFKPGLPKVDPTGAAADQEVQVFLAVNGLILDGAITDAPALSGSKGKQFKAKPNKEFKGTHLFRLWVVHENRAVASVFSESPAVKPTDADEFFKTIAAIPVGGGVVRPSPRDWELWWSPRLHISFSMPGVPQVYAGWPEDPVVFYWPKDGPAEGGAKFLLEVRPVKIEQFADNNKAYAEMEKAVKGGKFGANPTNLKKRMLGDRPGVTFDLTRGDTPYSNWAIFYSEVDTLVLSVRRNAGLTAGDESKFYDSLRFEVLQDPRAKKENPGGPSAPGRPGGAPGSPGGPPPGGPPPVTPPG